MAEYRNRRIGTRGQFEILGLTFVIVLVLMGVLFGLYIMNRPAKETARDFSQSQLAANWLNTYKGTTTDCHNATVTSLLSDCASGEQIECFGETSCEYVKHVTEDLLQATFNKWNREYNFSIEGPGGLSHIAVQNGSCHNKNIQRDEQPIPTGAGTIFLKLTLCTG